MAEILRFVPKPLPPIGDDGNVAVSNGPGEVIIFPGVRFERTEFRLSDRIDSDEPQTKETKSQRPKRNKK